MFAVRFAHLLQADDVGIKLVNRQADVVNLQPATRTYAVDALVYVPGRNPNAFHSVVIKYW